MRPRRGFTLLEVLLAMAISVVVLGAVYTFIGYQLRQASAGREVIERATLARAIFQKIDGEIRCAVALNDPGRFRLSPSSSGSSSSGGASGSTGASGAGATSGAATGTSSGASGGGTPAMSGSSSGGSSGGSGSSSSSDSSSGSGLTPVELPLGVIGSSSELHMFITRLPGESGQPTSDLRRVSYWKGGDGSQGGLCRMQIAVVTSDEATDTEVPTGDLDKYVFAPEVRSLKFSYFDGTDWTDSWDSTSTGPDGSTPMGSPRAIAITIGLALPTPDGKTSRRKTYRHVVPILTANGTPTNQNSEGGTTPP